MCIRDRAIDNFDTSVGVKFSTYAVPMIIGEIRRYLRDNSSYRIPRSLRDIAYKAMQAKERLAKNAQKEPTLEEIAAECEIPVEDVVYALDAIQTPLSLFDPVYTDGGDTLYVMDQISDKKNKEENWVEDLALQDAINRLNDREKYIINLRFFEGKTQMEVAEEINKIFFEVIIAPDYDVDALEILGQKKNRIILVRILATVIMLLVLGITARRAKLIPGRWQGAVEWLIEFVRDNIVYQVMGELRGKRYVPMITTVFCTLLVFNLCGIIPGFNIAASASITLPLVFAMWCFCQYWIAGIREKGLGHFLRDEIFPKGVPAPIYILLSPIQLLELLIIRPFSLTIRLFANMVSGHLILALCLSATQFFLVDVVNKLMMPFGIITFAAGMFMFLFEALVACLQAYIFAILTTAYINMSYPEID